MRSFDYSRLYDKAWDTDILNLVSKIHECKGRQDLFIRQKPVELDRLVEIAKIQSTEASNKIEGIVTTGTRMKQLFQEKTTPRNRDLVKRAGFSYGGRFKSVQNYINETKSDGTVVTRFTPIAPCDTPDAVENLCNAYEQAIANEKIDALILIPTFICDFLCIHPFNDGNGRMSRLLTLLLLYKNGYNVGKYISIEKQIEKTKDRYYDTLEESDAGWHEEANDPMPFIRYMLQVLLACYIEFEDRVGLMNESRNGSTAYDMVKKYAEEKLGKFTGADVVAHCPSIGRSSVLAALKKLSEEGIIIREGSGRNTFYYRADSK